MAISRPANKGSTRECPTFGGFTDERSLLRPAMHVRPQATVEAKIQ